MNEFGHFALVLAWGLALVGFLSGIYAGRSRSERWFHLARNATMLCGLCGALSLVALGGLFLSDSYYNQYVWQHSNRDMDPLYKVSAIWGGMDGSMLLWACFLSFSSALVGYFSIQHSRKLMPWVLCVSNSSTLFFLSVVVYLTNPFRYVKWDAIPPDGNGLNPLLQNPYMAIHPPTLYAGFTTFAVPYAFCVGAMLAGGVGNEWIRLCRSWTLVAWGFLSAGIVLGGHWAYVVLGWGGFWAWDPVENASFLPWLVGTAFLHTVMVQERKNMLKFWTMWLVVLTYSLTVFGTFLTRSGIVQSVHAFASTEFPEVFLVYLAIVITVAALVSWHRRDELRSERKIESFFSREAAFLVNNLILLSIAFATLWGVLFPVLSEAITGTKQTVGVPFFNAVNGPLFLLLIFMMGVGPLIAWRRASLRSLQTTFLPALVVAFFAGCALMWGGISEFRAVVSYSLCFFVFLTIIGELYRGARAQRDAAGNKVGALEGVQTLVRRHRSRYGGHLVHIGVLIMTIAITASFIHKQEKEFSLAVGEKLSIGRYTLQLKKVEEDQTPNYDFVRGAVTIQETASGKELGTLSPEMRVYRRNRETTSEPHVRSTLREDLYLVMAGVDGASQRVSMKVFINPLQFWLWIGTLVMLAGTGIVLLPKGQASLRAPVASGAAERA